MRVIGSLLMLSLPAALLAGLIVSGPGAAAAEKIPIIYSTDLFHPHDDPDDHVDLATLFALDEFEVLGVILEHGEKQAARPGEVPVRQMMQLTGRQVPYVVGLNPPLRSPSDPALDQPAAYQQGVSLLLEKLRSADRPVTLFTTGSMRDVAAAFNREPDLLRQKVSRIYMNIGNATPQESEYNVDLDVHAYVCLLRSGLPVYWCPCFGSPHGTYWKFRQADVFETAPAALQNFFLYTLTMGADWQATPRPESADPIAFLAGAVDPAARQAVFQLDRNMWCTAPFLHAAGRQVVARAPGGWEAVRAGQPAADAVVTFDFVPGRVTVDERGRTTFQEGGQLGDPGCVAAFKVLDPERYQAVMTSCLQVLFRRLNEETAAAPAEPISLRAESLTLLPQSQPVVHVRVRNEGATPFAGQVALAPPDSWRITPAAHAVQLAPHEEQRLAFSTAGASEVPSNSYPVELSAANDSVRVSRRQNIAVTSAPYLKPTIDGDPGDWHDAIPVSFVAGGRQTVIRTGWHRRAFAVLVAVEEAALNRPGQHDCWDAVQLALAPAGAAGDWARAETAGRFEYLLVPGDAGDGTCYRLATMDTPMSLVDEPRSLDEALVHGPAELAVCRVGNTTYYECSLPWDEMRPAIRPAEGREFCLSVLVHDPDGTGLRDWGAAAGLWDSQRHARAWSNWQGAQWPETPPLDSRTPWGLCSSRY